MEEKKYPIIEEVDGTCKVCEPAAGYAATSIDYANNLKSADNFQRSNFAAI